MRHQTILQKKKTILQNRAFIAGKNYEKGIFLENANNIELVYMKYIM